MKYIINQKLFSIGDDFNILDENKNKAFKVDGKILTITKKLNFEDSNGNIIYKIKKKMLHLKNTYVLEKDGETIATIKKDLINIMKDKFEVETPYGLIKVKGNFIDYNYKFKLDKQEIATVSKKIISLRDKYIVDIENFEDEPLILATAIVIDMICHNKDDEEEKDKK